MNKEYIQTIYSYSAWANQRVLDRAKELSAEQLKSESAENVGSIHNTLVHIMGAQEIWLARFNGVSPRQLLNAADFSTLGEVRQYWNEVEAHTHAYVDAIDEADLDRVIEYTNTKGKNFKYPLWQMLLHQANHAAQHRSEVALMLTQLGQSPGDLDFLRYIDAKGSG